jgi:hypothetical protein
VAVTEQTGPHGTKPRAPVTGESWSPSTGDSPHDGAP